MYFEFIAAVITLYLGYKLVMLTFTSITNKFVAYLTNVHESNLREIDEYWDAAELGITELHAAKEKETTEAAAKVTELLKVQLTKMHSDNMQLFEHIRKEHSSDLTERVMIAAYQVVQVYGKEPRGIEDAELTKSILAHQAAGLAKASMKGKFDGISRDGGLN